MRAEGETEVRIGGVWSTSCKKVQMNWDTKGFWKRKKDKRSKPLEDTKYMEGIVFTSLWYNGKSCSSWMSLLNNRTRYTPTFRTWVSIAIPLRSSNWEAGWNSGPWANKSGMFGKCQGSSAKRLSTTVYRILLGQFGAMITSSSIFRLLKLEAREFTVGFHIFQKRYWKRSLGAETTSPGSRWWPLK